MTPARIFIEKGFSDSAEKERAKELVRRKRVSAYIMSQYRFSKAIKYITLLGSPILDIHYDWLIEKGDVKEWGYHINSIDNFLKGTKNEFYVTEFGEAKIDKLSSYDIRSGGERRLYIDIDTRDYTIIVSLGATNAVLVKSKDGKFIGDMQHVDEDCMENQIEEIIFRKYDKLEKL